MAKKLKVAITLESTLGGTRKHAREIALGLDPGRFEVHLVVSLRRGREILFDLPAYRARGVRVHEVPMAREISPAEDALSLYRLVRLFRRERFDIVHTHSAKAGFLGRLAARLAGIPRVVHTPHIWPFQWARGARRLVYYGLSRLAARWCDALVCVGPGQKSFGLTTRVAPGGKLVVIENGVDVSLYSGRDRAAVRDEVRRELELLPGELAVGMVARIAPQKGVGNFLEAAALVARANRDARFFLVGSGPIERVMRGRARALGLGPARFRFLGHREDVTRLYAGFDVFALSSLYEGLPYVVLEAMAAGLAVVATRVTGVEDVIADGATGRLASPDEPAEIAQAVIDLLADEAERARLGAAARKKVEERYRPDRFVEAHARLYRGGD